MDHNSKATGLEHARCFFKKLFKNIIGMNTYQVKRIIEEEFPRKRPVSKQDEFGIQYTLDPDDGRYNSEFIILCIENDKVIWKHYSPD